MRFRSELARKSSQHHCRSKSFACAAQQFLYHASQSVYLRFPISVAQNSQVDQNASLKSVRVTWPESQVVGALSKTKSAAFRKV